MRSALSVVGLLLLGLASCEEGNGDPAKGPVSQQGSKVKHDPNDPRYRNIPAHESKIRTITGVDLEKLDGKAGDWARQQRKIAEAKRKAQGWLQPPDIDLGERQVGKLVTAKFKLRNPTAKTQSITGVTSSCICQAAWITLGGKRTNLKEGVKEPIKIKAGEQGTLEAVIEVQNKYGMFKAALDLMTTDPDLPSVRVNVVLVAVHELEVYQGESLNNIMDLGLVTKRSSKDFEFTVKSRDGKAFEIKGHEELPEAMKISFEATDDSRAIWKIHGKLGPGLDKPSAGGTVVFGTDRDEKVLIQVFALVMPPIKVTPASVLAYGVVNRKSGATREIKLEAVDAKDRFEVGEVRIDWEGDAMPADSKAKLEVLPEAAGRKATVRVTLPKGMRSGRQQGDLHIRFKDDKFDPVKVSLIAYVR